MRIILIRHLPTPGNEKHQYIRTTDENLSRGAVERFRQENRIYPQAEYIIASPMKRCLETAQLIYPNRALRVEPCAVETEKVCRANAPFYLASPSKSIAKIFFSYSGEFRFFRFVIPTPKIRSSS